MYCSNKTRSAAVFLAAALAECFPESTFLSAGPLYHGVYCDFSCSRPPSDALSVLLEEKLRQIVRERKPLRVLEMVPFSASELLKKRGLKRLASAILEQEGLVQLVEAGEFLDWSEGGHCAHAGELGVFRVLSIEPVGKSVYRIFCVEAPSKKEAAAKARLWKEFFERDHRVRGQALGLWKEGVWLAKGLWARRSLVDKLREQFSPSFEEVEGALAKGGFEQPFFECCREETQGEGTRGFLDQPQSLAFCLEIPQCTEAQCVLLLQMMSQSLTIFGFTFRVGLRGKKRRGAVLDQALATLGWTFEDLKSEEGRVFEFYAKDALECEWVVAEVREFERPVKTVAARIWVERNLSLLVEEMDGFCRFLKAVERMQES